MDGGTIRSPNPVMRTLLVLACSLRLFYVLSAAHSPTNRSLPPSEPIQPAMLVCVCVLACNLWCSRHTPGQDPWLVSAQRWAGVEKHVFAITCTLLIVAELAGLARGHTRAMLDVRQGPDDRPDT